MDIVFQAAARCGHRYEEPHESRRKECGKEIEHQAFPDAGTTREQFEEQARVAFQAKGWLVEGKKCRCPDHN